MKKKRNHKDFYSTVIGTTFFGILCLLLLIWETEDFIAIQNKDFKTISGQCVVTEYESFGKNGSHDLDVEIDGEFFTEDFDDFKDVQQGTYACTVKYIEKTGTLYEVKSQSTNN